MPTLLYAKRYIKWLLYGSKSPIMILEEVTNAVLNGDIDRPEEQVNRLRTILIQLEDRIYHGTEEEVFLLVEEISKISDKRVTSSWLSGLKEMQDVFWFVLILFSCIFVCIGEGNIVVFGSMRPSLLQNDRIWVSKMDFGVRMPVWGTSLLMFEDNLHRGDPVIFNVKGLGIPEYGDGWLWNHWRYKRFVKRCIAKSEDTVYFYGGLPYVVDKNGKLDYGLLRLCKEQNLVYTPIVSQYVNEWKKRVNYSNNEKEFQVFCTPIVSIKKLQKRAGVFIEDNEVELPILLDRVYGGELVGGGSIIPSNDPNLYGVIDDFDFLLKITHSITLNKVGYNGSIHNGVEVSYLGLTDSMLQKIFSHICTDRLVIRKGGLYLWSDSTMSWMGYLNDKELNPASCLVYYGFEDVPDGVYEFVDGQCYRYSMLGDRRLVPKHHQLMQFSPARTMLLFNYGVIGSANVIYQSKRLDRLVMLRDGSLYVDRHKLMSAEDFANSDFATNEMKMAFLDPNYNPFIDQLEGVFSSSEREIIAFVSEHGVKVPKGYAMVLGDNYAVSVDSRIFGFVPIENIEGRVVFRFWPLSGISLIPGTFDEIITPSRVSVSMICLLVLIGVYVFRIYRYRSVKDRLSRDEI